MYMREEINFSPLINMEAIKMRTVIKKWYQLNYPTDELGSEIREDITFKDLWTALKNNEEVYDLIYVHDSLVRERLFQELANIMDVDYNVVYDQWLNLEEA